MQFRSSYEHGSRRRGHLEAIQPPRHARAHAQEARAASRGGNSPRLVLGPARRVSRRGSRRGSGTHRCERVRKVDAPAVDRRAGPAHPGSHQAFRQRRGHAVAGRHPGSAADGARERHHGRDLRGPVTTGGPREDGRHRRVRRARAVSRRSTAHVQRRHAPPPRLRGGDEPDAGAPAHRRGSVSRRPPLPGEVRGASDRAAGARNHGAARVPRREHRPEVLQPRALARTWQRAGRRSARGRVRRLP